MTRTHDGVEHACDNQGFLTTEGEISKMGLHCIEEFQAVCLNQTLVLSNISAPLVAFHSTPAEHAGGCHRQLKSTQHLLRPGVLRLAVYD